MIKSFANKQLKALWETGKSRIDVRMHHASCAASTASTLPQAPRI